MCVSRNEDFYTDFWFSFFSKLLEEPPLSFFFSFRPDTCVSAHAPSRTRQRQRRVKFTGHSRIMGPRFGTGFISLFWRLKFGGGFYNFGKFIHNCYYTQGVAFLKISALSMTRKTITRVTNTRLNSAWVTERCFRGLLQFFFFARIRTQ